MYRMVHARRTPHASTHPNAGFRYDKRHIFPCLGFTVRHNHTVQMEASSAPIIHSAATAPQVGVT